MSHKTKIKVGKKENLHVFLPNEESVQAPHRPGPPWRLGAMEDPLGSIRAGPGIQGRSHRLSQGWAAGGTGAAPAPASGTSWHRVGQGWAGMWAYWCTWLRRAPGQAGQGSGELETGPAVVVLGQGLTAPGGWNGVLGCGQGGGATGFGQGQAGLAGPQGHGRKNMNYSLLFLIFWKYRRREQNE